MKNNLYEKKYCERNINRHYIFFTIRT